MLDGPKMSEQWLIISIKRDPRHHCLLLELVLELIFWYVKLEPSEMVIINVAFFTSKII